MRLKPRYYNSIKTLSVRRYFECIDTGELRPLIQPGGGVYFFSKFRVAMKLQKIWNNIEVEIVGIMMQDDDWMSDLLRRKREIIVLMEDSLADKKDPLTSIEAEAIRRHREEQKIMEKPVNYMHSLTALERSLGTQIDKDKMTVEEYLYHMQDLKRQYKELEKRKSNGRNKKK